jgi:thioredoxin-related protein
MSTRRGLLAASAYALAASVLPRLAQADTGPALPPAASLARELAAALATGKALVVMVSLGGCPYCKAVRESYLVPLRAEGQPVVQVELNRAIPVADFEGAASTHVKVVRALRVRVAPTVLFFGRGGKEAAPRIAGMPLPDFYGAYLQERVDLANRSIG